MSTRLQRNRRAKKSRYLLLALLGLMSFLAYTTHYNSSQKFDSDRIAEAVKQKPRQVKQQEVLVPFAERWEKMYEDADNFLLDNEFKRTRYFFEGYNVASNDEFVLPTEETGAGNPSENHVQDLSDAIVADMVPTGYSAGGSGASGGGVGGGTGAGGGGRGGDKNRSQYVALNDLEEGDNKGGTNNGGGSNEGVSTVPVPPAIWLLGSALLGFAGLRRK